MSSESLGIFLNKPCEKSAWKVNEEILSLIDTKLKNFSINGVSIPYLEQPNKRTLIFTEVVFQIDPLTNIINAKISLEY